MKHKKPTDTEVKESLLETLDLVKKIVKEDMGVEWYEVNFLVGNLKVEIGNFVHGMSEQGKPFRKSYGG